MPQGDHVELHRKRYGRQLDHEERTRKREARSVKKRAAFAQKALGLKGKMFAKQRYKEKATMAKTIAMHEQRDKTSKVDNADKGAAMPAYLLERDQVRVEDRQRRPRRCRATPRRVAARAPTMRGAAGVPAVGGAQGGWRGAAVRTWRSGRRRDGRDGRDGTGRMARRREASGWAATTRGTEGPAGMGGG